jgi:hypothetical protein
VTEHVERHSTYTRIGGGRYLLLNNRGTDLFVIYAYDEDGSAEQYDEASGSWRKVTGRRWGVRRIVDETLLRRDGHDRIVAFDQAGIIRALDHGSDTPTTSEVATTLRTRAEAFDVTAGWRR